MKTEKIVLSDTWQQVANASGVTTLQIFTGNARLYVGDTAPTSDDVYFRMSEFSQPVTLADTVNAWVKGNGIVVAVTV